MKVDPSVPSQPPLLASRFSLACSFAAGLVALFLYLITLAPSVTWKHSGADSGDLAAAAFTLGIPHPPGYPLFTLLASLFARLPFVEPAQGVGLLVAFAGALAVFILSRAGDALLNRQTDSRLVRTIAPIGALLFATGPALWSQATIAEVYTLNLVFVALILWAMVSSSPHRIAIAAAAFGLGMAHHLSIVLLVPGAWLALRPTRRDARLLTLLVAPLVLYAYLPLRASQAPAVNWGDASSLDGFLWVVTAAPYRPYFLDLSLVDTLSRVATTSRLLFDQFTPIGVALALWGLSRMVLTAPLLAAAFGLSTALVVGYAVLYGSRDSFIYLLPVFAIAMLWIVLGAADLAWLWEERTEYAQIPRRRRRAGSTKGSSVRDPAEPSRTNEKGGRRGPFLSLGEWRNRLGPGGRKAAQACVVGLLALIGIFNVWANFGAMNLSSDREAYEFARGIIEKLPNDAVIFADGDNAFFALVYYRDVIAYNQSNAVIVNQALLQYAWYYQQVRRLMSQGPKAASQVGSDYYQRASEIASVAFEEGRAVCIAGSSQLLPGFRYVDRDGLNCVAGRAK